MRIGLVLGGGGLTGGAFHAGVLQALAQGVGWDARRSEIIVGTSAGSITATSLRVGFEPADLYRRQIGQSLSPAGQMLLARAASSRRSSNADAAVGSGGADAGNTRRSLRPAAPELFKTLARRRSLPGLGSLAAAALPEGIESTASIERGMDALSSGRWPQPRPWITAVRLDDGQLTIFGRDAEGAHSDSRIGPTIGEAVAASCAIPGYFTPVTINGQRYVDGGMASICNADVLAGERLDAVIISAPMAIHASRRLPVDKPVRRTLRRQLDKEIDALRAAGTQVIAFAPTEHDVEVMGTNPMSPGREPAVAKAVSESVAARIAADPRIGELLR